MNSKIFFVVATAAILAGCGAGHDGGEFVGKWQNVDQAKVTEVIERNGDQFILTETLPNPFKANELKTIRSVATLNTAGNLVIPSSFGVVELAIDKKTGNLISSGAEFKRVE